MNENWDDLSERLRTPFPPSEERYRPGPSWEGDGGRWARPRAYIVPHAIFDRLDAVVGPGRWTTAIERLRSGLVLCRLVVLGVERADVGQAGPNATEPDKVAADDALGRAAAQFGLGRYLHALELPPVQLERREGHWVLPQGYRRAAGPSLASEPASVVPVHDVRRAADTAASQPTAGTVTAKQLGKIALEMDRVGWTDDTCRDHLQRTLSKRSRRELTTAEASRLIDHLIGLPDRLPAR